MTFYEEMAAVASELLAEFGAPVVFPRTTNGEPDLITGDVVIGVDDSVTTVGLTKNYPDKLIDGTRIRATDQLLIVTGAERPLMSDKPEMAGDKLGVVISIKTIAPIGIALVHFIQVRS